MFISFSNPEYFLFLLLIPLLFLIHLFTLRNKNKNALNFANFEAISRVKGRGLISKNISILILSVLLVLLLVLAVSGVNLHVLKKASSFSFVIAIDTSSSMAAKDIFPSRLEAAKETSNKFIEALPSNTRVGVVSFSGNSFIHQDVTDNKYLLASAVNEIELSDVEGTDIGEAVITSSNLLISENSKAIVLLSDGQINVGGIDKTIEYANKNNVIINTIAIGTEQGGETEYGISKLDEDSLKALSYNTEGNFFNANEKQGLLSSFENAMNLTEKKVAIDLTPYLIIASLIVFLIEFFLLNTRYKVLP
jgi:Ca-activated chloride channel family protein